MALSKEFILNVERNTRLQRDCELWWKMREGKITASIFGRILHCRENGNTMHNYLYPSKSFSSAATRWGERCEIRAIRHYERVERVKVQKVGLLLDSQGKLGASPDGAVPEKKKLIEVKCPYSLRRYGQLREAISQGRFYIKRDKKGQLYLDSNHSQGKSIFHQIQGQLALSDWPESTDLLVWTPTEYCIVNILRNDSWAKKNIPKLHAVCDKYMDVSFLFLLITVCFFASIAECPYLYAFVIFIFFLA